MPCYLSHPTQCSVHLPSGCQHPESATTTASIKNTASCCSTDSERLCIAAVTYRVTLAHVGYSLHFTMGWEMLSKLLYALGGCRHLVGKYMLLWAFWSPHHNWHLNGSPYHKWHLNQFSHFCSAHGCD